MSLERFCHIEIDTSGAHSFLTIPVSRDWKALIMKDSKCVLIVEDNVLSRFIERIRRNRLENSTGLSVKISRTISHELCYKRTGLPHVGRCSRVLIFEIKTISRT